MSLKFGTFMAPFHCPVGQDPTAAYERDLDVIKRMDTAMPSRPPTKGTQRNAPNGTEAGSFIGRGG